MLRMHRVCDPQNSSFKISYAIHIHDTSGVIEMKSTSIYKMTSLTRNHSLHSIEYGGSKGRPSQTWNIPHGAFPRKHLTFPCEHQTFSREHQMFSREH